MKPISRAFTTMALFMGIAFIPFCLGVSMNPVGLLATTSPAFTISQKLLIASSYAILCAMPLGFIVGLILAGRKPRVPDDV